MNPILFKYLCQFILFLMLCGVAANAFSAQPMPIRVGIYENAPLISMGTQGRPTGLFIDVLEEAFSHSDREIQYITGSWNDVLTKLKNGDIDLLPAIALTEDRQANFSFSDQPIFINWGQVFVAPGHNLDSLLALDGKAIGLLRGDIHNTAFRKLIKRFDLQCASFEYDAYNEVLNALTRGKVDAAILNRLYGVMHAIPRGFHPTSIVFNPIQIQFAVTKGDPQNILPAFNKAINDQINNPQSVYYQSLNQLFSQQTDKSAMPGWLLNLSVGLFITVLVFAVFAVMLRRKVRLKTAELEYQKDQLELEIHEREAIQQELERHAEHLKSLFQLSQLESDDEHEIAQYALDEAIRLTDSTIGFISTADENSEKFFPTVYSHNVMDECSTPIQEHFAISLGGWWSDAVRTGEVILVNDYALPSPSKKGIPQGHISLSRFVSVPVVDKNRVVAVIAVANKSTDYTQTDIAQLNLLAQGLMTHKQRHLDQCLISDHQNRYRTLVHSVGEGIVLIDADGIIQTWNKVAEKLFHIAASDIVGQPIRTIAPYLFEHNNQKHSSTQLFESISKGSPLHDEIFCVRLPDTPDSWIKCTMTPLEGDDQTSQSTILSFSDMTEQERIKKELLSAKDAAETANKAKSQFLANMSHELRTPLNGAMGMLQLLRMTELDKEQNELTEVALRSCNNLTRLLEDLLNLSKFESGKLEIQTEPFVIQDVIGVLRDTYEEEAKRKGIDISFHVGPNVPETASGDSIRIRQILFNLVGNAVKFTSSGSVECSMFAHKGSNNRFQLVILITDTGIGIHDDVLDSIFTPFIQVDSSFTRKFQGAGLGLPIVKRLVQLMQGSICIDSTPGHGTSIGVSLPLLFDAVRTPISTTVISMPDTPPQEPARILLVEDDSVNQLCVQRMLQVAGYTTICADNGVEALKLLEKHVYQLILMDIQMPIMGGLEAVTKLRNNPDYASNATVPVIALTAYAMQGDKERFIASGIDNYLSKPIDMDELLQLVEDYIGKGAASSS